MKAYSLDLRKRIFSYSLSHSIKETAKAFNVGTNTVFLLRKRFLETGSLEPIEKKDRRQRKRLISEEGEMFIRLLISEQNDLTLSELCDRYYETYKVKVAVSTMFNTLKRLKITLKKKSFSDPKKDTEENKEKKQNYDENIRQIDPDKIFFLDETGSCLNMSPSRGRSLQGYKAYDKKPTSPGVRINTVAVLTTEGIKCQHNYKGGLNSKKFISYLDTYVVPEMKEGQIIIMDNVPAHKSKAVETYLSENKINHIYLPKYSPDLNPIEEAFSKIKQFIKKQKARTEEKLVSTIEKACNTITIKDSIGYFNHALSFSY